MNKTINVLHRLKSGVSCGYGVPPNKLGGQGLKVIVMNKSKETVTAGFSRWKTAQRLLDIQFTHRRYPDCMHKMYPDYVVGNSE